MSDAGDFKSDDEDSRPLSAWPERILIVGLAIGVVALFLPWWGYSYNNNSIGNVLQLFEHPSGISDGFGGWGLLYVLAWLAATLLLLLRTVAADAADAFDLPVTDWFVYQTCAALMAIGALAVWDSVLLNPAGTAHVGVRYGWWLALVGAIIVLVGSLLLRSETHPVANPTG